MSAEEQTLPVTTSSEPDWAEDARAIYRDIILHMNYAGVPYAIAGAFALRQHTGIWRDTKDLDFFVPPHQIARALRYMSAQGFQVSIEDSVWLAKARRGDYFVDLITGLSNACLVVDDTWIARAIPGKVLGIPCRILAAEEMIASKIFITRRERFDGADIVHLLRSCGPTLDWDRLLHLTGPHWQLLYWNLVLFAYIHPAHTAVVPERIWHQLAALFENHVMHPRKSAPFRGSLIDPKMFAIDVDEWGERDLNTDYRACHPCLIQIEGDETKG
jgi:hypothetical protein